MELKSKIYIAGGESPIGRAILHELEQRGYENLIGRPGEEADLTDPLEVERFFSWASPEYVFLTAGESARVRSPQDCPATLLRENLLSECNVVHQAYRHGVKKLLYVADFAGGPGPFARPVMDGLLSSDFPEGSGEAEASANIAGIRLCQAYRSQYGANFISGFAAKPFGPRDDFGERAPGAVAGLMRIMHRAKQENAGSVNVPEAGSTRREFIFSRDLAAACLKLMDEYEDARPIHLCVGAEICTAEFASVMKEVIGFRGELRFDGAGPDGPPPGLPHSGKSKWLGGSSSTPLREALQITYDSFLQLNRKRSRLSGRVRASVEETW